MPQDEHTDRLDEPPHRAVRAVSLQRPRTLGERLRSAIEEWGARPENAEGKKGALRRFQEAMERRIGSRGGKQGVTYRSVLSYVSGESEPTLEWLRAAARLLDVRAGYLILGEGEQSRAEQNAAEARFRAAREVVAAYGSASEIDPLGSLYRQVPFAARLDPTVSLALLSLQQKAIALSRQAGLSDFDSSTVLDVVQQLLQAPLSVWSRYHLKSETYEAEAASVFALQVILAVRTSLDLVKPLVLSGSENLR